MFVTEVTQSNLFDETKYPIWVINFPTKDKWRGNSQIKWIVDGLQDLRRVLLEKRIKSVAIPALGAGNGGLKWAEVRPKIEQELGDLDAEILVSASPCPVPAPVVVR